MRITTEESAGLLEVRLCGRLDNESVDDLDEAVSEILRRGHHAALVDLREVDYISSAGLGTLVRCYKRFQAIHGMFGVGAASSHATEIIRLTGLAKLLMCDPDEIRQRASGGRTTTMPSYSVAATDELEMQIYEFMPQARQQCSVWGDPMRLTKTGYDASHCRTVSFAADSVGFGIAALGKDFEDCSGRFGEFLAVGGGVIVQPTPDGGKPDYQLAAGEFVPRPHVLYGASCTGDFARMVRFSPAPGRKDVEFSRLVSRCLEHSPTETATLVFVAESAGLIGAGMRRSPAAVSVGGSGADFTYPGIRNWLSFTPERTHSHTLTLIVGIASRHVPAGVTGPLLPLLRPLGGKSGVHGHFHAAVFSYRPLKKRKLDLVETTATLLESEDLQAVLHLLNDDRAISGGGESRFAGGACWIGPLAEVVSEKGQ